MPVFDGTYYVIASVCPSVCPGLVDRTVSPMVLQASTFDQHGERKTPIVLLVLSEAKVKVELSHSRKTL